MATAEQILSLIKSHTREDREHFYTVALQIASYEARRGHQNFADDIRKAFVTRASEKREAIAIPDNLRDIVVMRSPEERFSQLVLGEHNKRRLDRVVREYVKQEVLKQHGLGNRRKVLLAGPPGTGKTMTAGAIANTLCLPLFSIQLDMILSRYMGESSAKLHMVFDFISKHKALYLFDEFDTLGGDRGNDDIGEMRRILNTLLLCIEQDASKSLIFAATNKPEMLDRAIFRRFDDFIIYELPNKDAIVSLIHNTLAAFLPDNINLEKIASDYEGLSCAEVVKACEDAAKLSLLESHPYVTQKMLELSFNDLSTMFKIRK